MVTHPSAGEILLIPELTLGALFVVGNPVTVGVLGAVEELGTIVRVAMETGGVNCSFTDAAFTCVLPVNIKYIYIYIYITVNFLNNLLTNYFSFCSLYIVILLLLYCTY